MLKIKKNNKAQIWIETATYTLIGLIILGILLATTNPQIEKIKDKSAIVQTKEAMDILDNELLDIKQSPGNIRIIDFKLSKGFLEIDAENDSIRYTLENTRLKFSQPNETIMEGNFLVKTEEQGDRFIVSLLLNYSTSLNITCGDEIIRTIHPGTIAYKIKVENVGDNTFDEKTHIDFDII